MAVKAAAVMMEKELVHATDPATTVKPTRHVRQRAWRANQPLSISTRQDKFTVVALSPKRGERVLEVGCGAGRRLPIIARAGAASIGLDPSPEFLRAANRRFPEGMLLQCDIEQAFPLIGNYFDAALCVFAGEHPERLHFLLREVHRVLRPGGRVLLALHYPEMVPPNASTSKGPVNLELNFYEVDFEMRSGPFRYSPHDYVTALHQAGFYDVRQHEDGEASILRSENEAFILGPKVFPTQVILQALRPNLQEA